MNDFTKDIQWWWLSYADESGFKGAVILCANDFIDACKMSAILGLNPLGEVQGMPFTDEALKKVSLYDTFRLLNKTEALNLAGLIDNE